MIKNLLTWPTRLSESSIHAHLLLHGDPVSKQRPRFAGGRAYTPSQTAEAEDIVGWKIREARRGMQVDSMALFGVRVHFARQNRRRRDLDNMVKLLLDAATGVIWADDVQVVELIASRSLDADNPHTEAVFYRVEGAAIETGTCQQCGKKFPTHPSWAARKFCSRACMAESFRKPRPVVDCGHCGNPILAKGRTRFCSHGCETAHKTLAVQCLTCGLAFRRPRSLVKAGRVFCSEACRATFESSRPTRTPVGEQGVCLSCGKATSKKRYNLCLPCTLTQHPPRSPGRQKRTV